MIKRKNLLKELLKTINYITMKTISCTLFIIGISITAQAQSNSMESTDVKTECVPGQASDSNAYHQKRKKYNSKMAWSMKQNSFFKHLKKESPYDFAPKNLKNSLVIEPKQLVFRRKNISFVLQ